MISIVSLIVLARVLTPEDFGLVAIAMIFVNFTEAVGNTGGQGYVLSRDKLDDDIVFTNWTLNFLISFVLGLVLAASCGLIADYYNDDRLINIILALGLLIIVRRLTSPKLVYKRKRQELGAISTWMIINKFVSVGLTISIALIYESYWALVVGHFISSIGFTLASYYISPSMPKFTLKNVKPQWAFSKWIMPQSVVSYLKAEIDTIYVSGQFDKATIGAYSSMRYYSAMPNKMFINTAISTLLPQLAEMKNNKKYFAQQLQVLLFIVALISCPIILLMNYHANFIIGLVLGEQWQQFSDLFAIFAFMIVTRTLSKLSNQLVMLSDKTKHLFYFSIVSVIVQLTVFMLFDFESVYQLATYKLIFDVLLAVGFYIYLTISIFNFKILLPMFSPIFPVATIAVVSGFLSSLLVAETNHLYGFLAHCFSTVLIFVILNLCLMIPLRKRVRCYDYGIKIFLKGSKKILKN